MLKNGQIHFNSFMMEISIIWKPLWTSFYMIGTSVMNELKILRYEQRKIFKAVWPFFIIIHEMIKDF